MNSNLRVLFLAAEADPWIKIGGLGDVAGSLPAALRRLALTSHEGKAPVVDVRLAIPFHGAIQRQGHPLRRVGRFHLPYAGGTTPVEVLSLEYQGVEVYFIGGPLIPADAPVYTSDTNADGLKFTFFSLAALELARQLDWAPQVVHANDWHTAPAVYALNRNREQDAFYRGTVTVLGLHNLPYLGIGAGNALASFNLPPASGRKLPGWARNVPLALGLLSADHIVAVSPTYAREILTPEFGAGLDGLLRKRAGSISGILNGLDVTIWDPVTDENLTANYSPNNLELRQTNKSSLQAEFDLEQNPLRPLLAVVSRLDRQKGIDLVAEALRCLSNSHPDGAPAWQAIILGTGAPELETSIRDLEADFPRHARAVLRFDAALSHRIYAGADILMIPSRYEPCGISQMIAMRYGCVPVGRATGGLRDTIQDFNQSDQANGFLFEEATSEALSLALERAISAYKDQNIWRGLQKRGMLQDFSWKRSACQYLELYSYLVQRGRP